MEENIQKAVAFLREQFDQSVYLNAHEDEKKYRFEHTMRVANIGREIAENEGMDVEGLVIGCILHDVSYINEMKTREDSMNHGREAARIARPFLEGLGFEAGRVNEICYGIAIHVDDKADFDGERTTLALSIGDCDNIDRFDVYRIYDTLRYTKYENLTLEEATDFVDTVLSKLNEFLDMELGTKTAKKLWLEKVRFQIEFFERLKRQIDKSVI